MVSCKYCNGKGIPHGDPQEFCVFENHGHPEIAIHLGNGSARAYIDFCPKCGRHLKAADKDFEYSVKIPVPLGEKVWTFWTNCCNACCFQPRKNQPIHCSRTAPCHTLKHSIQSKTLTYANMQDVIENWGIFYFKTSAEAEAAGNKRVADNIQQMRNLGYVIDDDGYAIRQKGWDIDDE